MNLSPPSNRFLDAVRRRRTLPAFRTAQPAHGAPLPPPADTLASNPALAYAATVTTARLDVRSGEFSAVKACLEQLCRLKLNKRAVLVLVTLAQHGPQKIGDLAANVRANVPCTSQIVHKLQAQALVARDRDAAGDHRHVHVTLTEAGERVLASIVALTGLGHASAVLLQTKN